MGHYGDFFEKVRVRASDGLAEWAVPEHQVTDRTNFLGYQLAFFVADQELYFSGSCEFFEGNMREDLL